MDDLLEISIFDNLYASVCEQMGESLRRTARSINIKDRLDFSAALFDVHGELVAQAAHIPVHVGSMAFALKSILDIIDPAEDEMLITNDPYGGGTHLPDITVICPVSIDGRRIAYLANRAHHADVGGTGSGSMAPASRLEDEGVVISPRVFWKSGHMLAPPLNELMGAVGDPVERHSDLMAQVAANLTGRSALLEILRMNGLRQCLKMMDRLKDYSSRAMENLIEEFPVGVFSFVDHLDDDGVGRGPVQICATIERLGSRLSIDFDGTAPAVPGNLNAVLPVAVASVFYVFRCLLGEDIPSNAGCLRPLDIKAPAGTVVNAQYPSAVAGGNVETSQRIVDVLLGALAKAWPGRIPAASQGTMNNLSLNGPGFAYYETIAGGMGAGPSTSGLSAVQSHMTNTRNSSVETLEFTYPLRVVRYELRRNSGGNGVHRGGDGVVRELEALAPIRGSLLAERRSRPPWGLAGGQPGKKGFDQIRRKGRWFDLPSKGSFELAPGDRISISTPGGGGWGDPE